MGKGGLLPGPCGSSKGGGKGNLAEAGTPIERLFQLGDHMAGVFAQQQADAAAALLANLERQLGAPGPGAALEAFALPCLALPCLHQTCAMLMGNPVQLHKGAQ